MCSTENGGAEGCQHESCSQPHLQAHSPSLRGNNFTFPPYKGKNCPLWQEWGTLLGCRIVWPRASHSSQAAAATVTAHCLSSLMWLQFWDALGCTGMLTVGELANPEKPNAAGGKAWRLLCTRSPCRRWVSSQPLACSQSCPN